MRKLTVWIEDDLHRSLRLQAAEADTTISDLVRERIANGAVETPAPPELPPPPPPNRAVARAAPTTPAAEVVRKVCPDNVYSWHGRPGSYKCPTCGKLCEGPS